MSQETIAHSKDPFDEGWIEDGLYYRGQEPPKHKSWTDDDWIYLPHENYIPISKSRILSALSQELKGHISSEHMQHFVELLEGVYHFHYHKTLNQLKEDYEYFAPSTGDLMRQGVPAEEIDQREQKFLLNFIMLMIRGNFNPLSSAEQYHASLHTYLLDLPIDINWSIQDPQMIKALLVYSQTDAGRAHIKNVLGVDDLIQYLQMPKAYDDRALVFHRGIKPDQVQGVFLLQKLNILIDKIFQKILSPLHKGVERVGDQTEHLIEGAVQGAVSRGKSVLAGRPFAPRLKTSTQSANVADGSTSAENYAQEIDQDVVFLPRWLHRTSLQNQPFSLKRLFKPSLLQEPAMERVICLFRRFPPSPPAFLQRIPLLGRFIKTPPPGTVDRTIYVKLFQNIPLADLDLIFPEKKIRMKSFDKFMLGFLGLIGLVTGIIKGSSSEKGALVIVFTVIALLAFKTVMRFINTRRRYMLQMSQDLYHKNLDNDIGVLQYLVDNIEDQEFKEAIIAYLLLVKAGKPISENELDEAAERLINDHFQGLEVDFEVDDALDKITVVLNENGEEVLTEEQKNSTMFLSLVRGIPQADGEIHYEAKPIEEALQQMDEKWDNYFQYS